MEASNKKLHRRSDGFVERADGFFACRVTSVTNEYANEKCFDFKITMAAETTRVCWPKDEIVSIYPENIVRTLLGRGWARSITDEELEAFNARQVDDPVEETIEPVQEPTVQQEPQVSPAPAPAPAAKTKAKAPEIEPLAAVTPAPASPAPAIASAPPAASPDAPAVTAPWQAPPAT
jgi:hypothetical protein